MSVREGLANLITRAKGSVVAANVRKVINALLAQLRTKLSEPRSKHELSK